MSMILFEMDAPDFSKIKFKKVLLAIPEDSINTDDMNNNQELTIPQDYSNQQYQDNNNDDMPNNNNEYNPDNIEVPDVNFGKKVPSFVPPVSPEEQEAENNFYAQFTQDELDAYKAEVDPLKKKYLLDKLGAIDTFLQKRLNMETDLTDIVKLGPYLSYTSLYILTLSALDVVNAKIQELKLN